MRITEETTGERQKNMTEQNDRSKSTHRLQVANRQIECQMKITKAHDKRITQETTE